MFTYIMYHIWSSSDISVISEFTYDEDFVHSAANLDILNALSQSFQMHL